MKVNLAHRNALKAFIKRQLSEGGKTGAAVNFIFCTDDELLEVNRTYLQHDYYTDIITFDLSEPKSSFLVSDIFISIDRVRDNAARENKTAKNELHRVIFHGLLHLLGYKDKNKEQKALMRNMEEEWLSAYVLAP